MNFTSIFLLFLTSLFIFELLELNEASQAAQLKSFLESRKSVSPRSEHPTVKEYIDYADKVVVNAYTSPQNGIMKDDMIHQLPGEPNGIDFKHFSGYVNVDNKSERALFYYFAECRHSPSKKPLVLWLNGGPGCSSFGYGAMQELGPFRVNSDGKTLQRNKYAWNNVANILFLESPVGVGFSYANKSEISYRPDDNNTAADSYTFLVNWFDRFPQYKDRKFYIVGESYAGHYIPQLTSVIQSHNRISSKSKINLRGIAIGNGYIDDWTTTKGQFEFMWSHALISDHTYDRFVKNCHNTSEDDMNCINARSNAISEIGYIDMYNIYAPVCHDIVASDNSVDTSDPCNTDYVIDYLNDRYVQKALHARPTKWEACSSKVNYNSWTDSTVPLIKQLIENGTNVWLYSGDVDTVVSVTTTKYAIEMLNLPIEKAWRAWYSEKQVGGYVVEYKGLTFVTVRGAGHEVPVYQGGRALTMLSSFLEGKELPYY